LSNLLFGKPGLRILEVNRCFEGEQLRPWFYLLAAGQKQYYSFLNVTAGELIHDRVHKAVDQLCSRLPAGCETGLWWKVG
jgi:hypothetical protein